jgi:hypothetical protein
MHIWGQQTDIQTIEWTSLGKKQKGQARTRKKKDRGNRGRVEGGIWWTSVRACVRFRLGAWDFFYNGF